MHPYWSDDGTVIAGLLDPYEGDIDPSGLTQSLARRSRSMGAEVRRHSRVVGIDRLGPGDDGRWRVHVDKGGDVYGIDCDIVINAAGFYGAEISAMAGIEVPLAVLEHQYLVTGAVPELVENTEMFPLVPDPEIMFYLRRKNDRLLFGNYGREGRTVWEDAKPDVFDASLFAPLQRPMVYPHRTYTELTDTVVRLETDSGLVGWGEVCPLSSSYQAETYQQGKGGSGRAQPSRPIADRAGPDAVRSGQRHDEHGRAR